jgi:anaerobic magnesium-protoporphyrin IX monomethyl ester cyclase
MDALFLVPPVGYGLRPLPCDRVYGCNYGFDYKPPIHFLQAATYARDVLGWTVRLMDCPAEGIDRAQFESEAGGKRYDVVAHWATYLSAMEDVAAARVIAQHHPDTRFVFMGAAATWRPEEFHVAEKAYALLGEPEHTLRDLDAAWRGEGEIAGMPGLGWFAADGVFSRGPSRALLDVTELPIPDRGLLLGTYRANRFDVSPVTTMAVSRGCGFRCTFCCTNAVDQAVELEFKLGQPVYEERPPLRKRSVDQIIAEFRDIASRGIKGVEIADNIFTWGKARTMAICAGIEDLGLHWVCLARANMLHDPEQIAAMARAGCKLVYMGSESFDDGLLDDVVKEIKVRDIERAVRTCRENGVEPEVSVLIGASPKETWRTLLNSWRASRRLGTRFVHFSVALPAPSTQMYDDAMANGWFVDGDFRPADNQRDVIINLPHLSRRDLQLALKAAYAAQYLTPRGVWAHAQRVRSVDDVRHKARAAGRLLGFLTERQDEDRPVIPPGRVTPSDDGGCGPAPRPATFA